MKKTISNLAILVPLLMIGACAPQTLPARKRTAQSINAVESVERRLEAARFLSKRGAHFEAAFQLEAALDEGGDEGRILPFLVAAQIRARRLRTAIDNLQRLMTIAPEHAHANELYSLLRDLAPNEAVEKSDEVGR